MKEIKRDYYLNKLIEYQNDGLIKIITGIRRCGKSYLLNTIFYNYLVQKGIAEDHIIKVAFDNDVYSNLLKKGELGKYIRERIIDKSLYYILLDEVQLVENFEFALNGINTLENVDIYVTGSNSKFLSSDIITEFRGRGEEIRVYPLSFMEFSSAYDKDIASQKIWEDYYTYGGLPLIVSKKNEDTKMNYLDTQVKNIYINDVVERNNIQNRNDLETLIEIISSSIGSLTNPTKLVNTFKSLNKDTKITDKTIYNYLHYLEEAFIIEKAERYDIKGKRYIETPQKYYFTDVGVRNSLINFRQQEENHLMENIIYIELRRRGFNVDVGVVETRSNLENGKKGYKQLEIDFIANKGNNKYYIQSALNLDTREKREQEEKSLLNVQDNFRKIIIVKDQIKRWRDDNGIVIISILDFLLDSNSLDY